jgi:RHS repeat-associated protein
VAVACRAFDKLGELTGQSGSGAYAATSATSFGYLLLPRAPDRRHPLGGRRRVPVLLRRQDRDHRVGRDLGSRVGPLRQRAGRGGCPGALALTDAHGDVLGQFTAAGTAVSGSQSYDPWGAVTATTGTLSGMLGFQSAWTDPAPGKDLMGARWYNPAAGDFTSADTVQVPPVPEVPRPGRGQPVRLRRGQPAQQRRPNRAPRRRPAQRRRVRPRGRRRRHRHSPGLRRLAQPRPRQRPGRRHQSRDVASAMVRRSRMLPMGMGRFSRPTGCWNSRGMGGFQVRSWAS